MTCPCFPGSHLAPILAALVLAAHLAVWPTQSAESPAKTSEGPHRSPVALALSRDGSRLLTANQTAGSVSLVDPRSARVLAEVATGDRPVGVAITPDATRGVVVHWFGYDLALLGIHEDRLEVLGRIEVGPEPRGVALAADGGTAFVALGAANEVARVDLGSMTVTGRLPVGREPRGIALTPDGRRLLVGNARSQNLSVVDVAGWKVERTLPIQSDNLRQIAIAADGKTAYVASMKNRGFATTKNNIDIGWVLGQRLNRVDLDGVEEFATLTLDPRGEATADAHGVAVSADGKHLAISSGGTHEVILFRADRKPLPWRDGSSRDLIAPELLNGDGRFRRVRTEGRPTELVFAPDRPVLYVANYLGDAIQVIDAESAVVTGTIPLGGPAEPSQVRLGEILFHDATRSFNQWYSCNTCHSEGHTNGLDFDTMNDGWQDNSIEHRQSRKKVPSLRGVLATGPWTWHGWQASLDDAMIESFTKSMQGNRPTAKEVEAIVAYLGTLEYPRNPHRAPDGGLSEAARRGEQVFRSPRAACNTCHGGPELTDGRIHDVGLNERGDVYKGHNPPSLRGTYDKDPYLHDGRAKTLRDALTRDHDPDTVNGLGALSDAELDDLIAYLRTL